MVACQNHYAKLFATFTFQNFRAGHEENPMVFQNSAISWFMGDPIAVEALFLEVLGPTLN